MLLAGNGLLLSNDAYLTLSFAADGVQVAGQSNALEAKFDPVASTSVWKDAILRAFQTWATHTNADIGVVNDDGLAIGTPGATRGDARFGDIRIAAIAMDPSVGAVAVPINRVVGGTWRADVLFNTNFAFQSANDIFEIALHEAGHVFGLDDSSDPASPLHSGTIPTATAPTNEDISNLQTLYGTRFSDPYESISGGGSTDNNSFAKAAPLDLSQVPGSAPLVLYGDITSTGDLDFYRFDSPNNYIGPITFHVRSSGISLLAPHLQVLNAAHQLLREVTSTSTSGDDLSITILNPTNEDIKYYVEVSGASSDLSGTGGYSLTLSLDNINQFDPATISSYSDATLRKLPENQLAKLLNHNGTPFVNDDLHADDSLATAVALISDDDFSTASRFEVVGSLSDQTDTDSYSLLAPASAIGTPGVLTVTIRSLAAGRLVPKLTAFNSAGQAIPVTLLANGGGELVAQIDGIQDEETYYLTVAAEDPNGPFNTGNYQLTASFSDQAANFQSFAAGTLDPGVGQNVHTLYVAEPQLFHFLLQASPAAVAGPAAVLTTIFNESGQPVYRLATPLGQTRSQGAVLLAPGTYSVSVSLLTLGEAVDVPVSYVLSGTVLSDPFASDPNDPTTNPFTCTDPGSTSAFCYPGEIMSNDPFLWQTFTDSLPNGPPAADLQTQISMLLGSWWSWFWAQTGANGPPLAQSDSYSTPQDTPLTVASGNGVLGNDIEPEGSAMTAVLSTSPPKGSLQFNADGSFQYVPALGYSGLVRFTYQASDFTQLSNASTVTLAVGRVGDYDHNGVVNSLDFDVWRANFGSTSNLAADGNGDGIVDTSDYTVWRDHASAASAAGAGASVQVAAAAPVAVAPVAVAKSLAPASSIVISEPPVASIPKASIVSRNSMQTLTPEHDQLIWSAAEESNRRSHHVVHGATTEHRVRGVLRSATDAAFGESESWLEDSCKFVGPTVNELLAVARVQGSRTPSVR